MLRDSRSQLTALIISSFTVTIGAWHVKSTPVNAEMNGFFTDVRAVLERPGVDVPTHSLDNGRTIYLASDAGLGGGNQNLDLYVATRESVSQVFAEPEKIEELSRPGVEDCCGYVTSNGLTMYFTSSRPTDGRSFPYNIWISERLDAADPWGPPQIVDVAINGNVWHPQLSPDGLTLYVSGNRGPGTQDDLFQATRNSQTEPFGTPRPLAINTPDLNERNQSVSSDELTVFYWLTDQAFSSMQIHVATRGTKEEPFGPSVPIDDFGAGSQLSSTDRFLITPVISRTWPAVNSISMVIGTLTPMIEQCGSMARKLRTRTSVIRTSTANSTTPIW
jgi:hypothetical protein